MSRSKSRTPGTSGSDITHASGYVPNIELNVSCESCKRRKVKCDRGQPSCAACHRNGAPCVYKARRKPGFRAGYGRELEKRMKDVTFVVHTRMSSLGNQGPYQGTHYGSLYQPHWFRRPFLPQMYSQPSVPLLDSVQRPPAPSNQNRRSADIYGNHQTYFLSSAQDNNLSDYGLPPYDLLHALIDLYFTYVSIWCPILHEGRTRHSLLASWPLDDADWILLHAIVATTLRFSADDRLTPERRAHYHDASKQKVMLYGHDHDSVKALQALIILAVDILGDSNGPAGRKLLALITKSAVRQGLAVETTSSSIAPRYPSIPTLRAPMPQDIDDFIELESRRRLFWMIYLLDRYATIVTTLEFSLDEKVIDRTLPCRDDLWLQNKQVQTRWFRSHVHEEYDIDVPDNLGPFSYYVDILGILTRIHLLKKPANILDESDAIMWQKQYSQLDAELAAWMHCLPEDVGNGHRLLNAAGHQNKGCTRIMLHATYFTAVIKLHSSAGYLPNRSCYFEPSYIAMQSCLLAVKNIMILCQYVVQNDNSLLSKLGPPFAFALWVAARILLVHSSNIEHRVSDAIHPLVNNLQEMGRHWKVGKRYADMLQHVIGEHRESGGFVYGTRILSDMRRCAYDLEIILSTQTRHSMYISTA